MLVSAERNVDLALPLSIAPPGKDAASRGFSSPVLDEDFDIFGGRMSGTGASSPLIKDEPDDWNYNSMSNQQQNFNMQVNHNFSHGAPGSVDPSELSVQNGDFGQYGFGGQQNNMTNSFNMGNSGIRDDELLDLDLADSHAQRQNQHQTAQVTHDNMHEFFPEHHNQTPNNQVQQAVFSSTPNGEPMHSPFLQPNFNYASYQQHMAQQVSPGLRQMAGSGSMQDYNFGNARTRHSLPHVMDRKHSDSRSPMTPKTPALGGLNLGGTPDSGSLPTQPISALGHRHQKSLSGQWDGTPGSMQSYLDSPLVSPSNANHAAISEVLKSGKHQSLPNKVDNGHHGAPAYQSQEAKRRRRRESHNMVERRRRDNINERIQELSHLVPQHRLDDEKVRKHLANNGPLSPSLAAIGLSPPQATSLLAAGGRRATGAGNITMGIPIEEKDKGPNKGDILNGSVGWTRDLMWALHRKFQQEQELIDLVARLGGAYPFHDSEDDKRMRTELMDAMDKNDANTFEYSRGHGSGLRVPKHTSLGGDPVSQQNMGTMSPQSLSPGMQSGGSGSNGNPQYWNNNNGRGSLSFKEEEEYDMQL